MTEIDTSNPLQQPYRTGSYLIYDFPSGTPTNFRTGMSLPEDPYRASGSHQLDIISLIDALGSVVATYAPATIHIVDLREETHGFVNGKAVSWYADNDFSNVGMVWDLITADEQARLGAMLRRTVQIFELENDTQDDLQQQRVLPVASTDVTARSVRTEKEVAELIGQVLAPTDVYYRRIPVTDHCAPSGRALAALEALEALVGGNDWVHFHCHGGDGRTSTFLCLYDILRWRRTGRPLPALEEFAARQYSLFPYCLDPNGTSCGIAPETGWKLPLEQQRWEAIGGFLGGRP